MDNNIADVSFTMSSTSALVQNGVGFISTSTDSDGSIKKTSWDFGDGASSQGTPVSHTYSKSGKYTVSLEVTDNDNEINSTTDTIIIANAYADSSLKKDNASSKNFTTIQKAVDNISKSGVVYVKQGEYSNGVFVNKSVSLYGEDGAIIDGSENNPLVSPLVNIVYDTVLMDGFTVVNPGIGIRLSGSFNSTICNCNILNSTTGIKIENQAEQNFITSCNFTNNTYGVFITQSNYTIVGSLSDNDNPVLDDCVFTLNNYGVYLDSAADNLITGCMINATACGPSRLITWGVCFDNSDNNSVVFCDVFNASNYGVYLSGSSDNMIVNSIIRDSDKGVYLTGSSNNMIFGNNITDSNYYGVSILTVSSSSNSILFNDFINNGELGRQASDSGTGNIWNTSNNVTYLYNGSGEGNNWSDYTGSDSDDDGIGDTTYRIEGTARAQDSYPVIEAYGWLYDWY